MYKGKNIHDTVAELHKERMSPRHKGRWKQYRPQTVRRILKCQNMWIKNMSSTLSTIYSIETAFVRKKVVTWTSTIVKAKPSIVSFKDMVTSALK